MPLPIASTRGGGVIPGTLTGTGSLPDYMSGLADYAGPNVNLGTTTATGMIQDPLQANIAAAPALAKIGQLVNQINQQAWLSAPGRQQQLGNIKRWQAGELDPSIYAQEASRAAQLYGGGGFGVDSPAWQAAVQRALVTNRQALQEKGGEALDRFYQGMPTADVTQYTVTPTDYSAALDRQRARELDLAGLRQQAGLEAAKLAQQRALEEQNMAYRYAELQQKRELANLQRGLSAGGSQWGYNKEGRRVPGGQYRSGYFDQFGRFTGTA